MSGGALAVLRERRYTVLFATLLATIAAGPLLSTTRLVGPVLEVFLGLSLIAAVMPMRKARDRMLLLAIVLAAVVIRHAPFGGRRESISLVLWSVVALFAAYRSMRYSLSDLRVNAEHVFAALNAYLLVGIFGGALCVALEAASPGSLLVQGKPLTGDLPMGDAIYFSFVTLATLGYGDIVPATAIARGFAVFEAIAGQFYLAVLVGRLVGLRTAAETTDVPR